MVRSRANSAAAATMMSTWAVRITDSIVTFQRPGRGQVPMNEQRDDNRVETRHAGCLGRREDAGIDAAENDDGMPSAQPPRRVVLMTFANGELAHLRGCRAGAR